MRQTHHPLKAALWMSGAIFSFSAMAIAAREINATHDSFEIMAARSVIGLGIVLVAGLATGQLGRITADRLSGHALRNVVHFTAQNLWFWALTLIPLAQVFALEFTAPIWVILLSPLVLGERLTRPRLSAAVLGFLGILIVARPDVSSLNPGVLAAAGAALGFAITSILTKRLTRGETIIGILFWLTVFQAVFGIVAAGYDGQITWPTAETLPWLGLIGVCGVLAHFSLTSALMLAPVSFVMPIDFLRLPLIAVIGALVYAEPLDPFVLCGGAVIFLGIWISVRAELGRRRG
ncbi:DMT family transporter [Tabrizicola oligotrophica]|uniref:DMT family transporter n=1 Tax=Tabrizicola oligotrophica TaxID=2710650 RepID=A0A6M0QPK2_9RHOB|nr:DMT family transporter [Tabrizicola oligotrophica]NEY89051.1 DMT family transporter [Tabrizicola oligotrophica]